MEIISTQVKIGDEIMVWGKFLIVTNVTDDTIYCGNLALARSNDFKATIK